jgi:hypothetical protein
MSTGDGVTGLDVSKWQTTTPSLAGHDFLFARASIGTKRDEMYATHVWNARKAGVLVGAYHFNHAPLSIADQVSVFLSAAGDVDFYALDVEGTAAFSHAQAADFIKRVQATGRKCGLYHSLSGFFDAGQDFDWVAYWSDQPPTRNWDIWQFGSINGIDGNRFNGTLTQLKALAGKEPMAQLPITSVIPKIIDIPVGAKRFLPDGTIDLIFDTAYANRFSPYAVGTMRAYYATVDGKMVVRLISGATNLRDATPPDATPFDQAQLDAATAIARGEGVAEGAAGERSRLRKLLGI